MTYKVDQFAALHPRVEGEIYVDWDKVRMLALKGEISTSQHDLLTGQLAKALLEKGRRIEDLEGALRNIEYLDRPQVRGQPRRVSIQEIALAALKGGSDE
tara:strand:+ start:1686 stop:1985 length:300 start_codon:yes stop_codon:yes gene_type:complete